MGKEGWGVGRGKRGRERERMSGKERDLSSRDPKLCLQLRESSQRNQLEWK